MPAEPETGIPTASLNPATGEILGYSPLTSPEEFRELIRQARRAQPGWAATPVRERARQILKVRDYVVARAEEIAETIARDNGKTRIDALATEVLAAALAAGWYAARAPRFLKDKRLPAGNILLFYKRSKLVRVPCGVIGIISPWNYPFGIPFHEVVKALLAGNAVILKTASETLQVGKILSECFFQAGFPSGVFQYVNMPGRVAGTTFLKAGIDKLFFTGSEAVGKFLMREAAETLTPLCLELGGNDAMLVCPDADLERAAAGAAWNGLSNCGQSCAGVERIYVHTQVAEPFLDLLKRRVEALRGGQGLDFEVDLGVMTTAAQIRIVEEHIADALEKGARILARSRPPAGPGIRQHIPATVLVNVNHNMRVMREETFGPVLAVKTVRDMEEALTLANDSSLGLTGSVWSRNRAAAEALARRLQAGAIMINDHLVSHGMAETPWGGFKRSGIGRRTHGQLGFEEMTQPQVLIHDYLPGARRNMWWYPYSRDVYRGLLGAMRFLYGKSLPQRLAGFRDLAKIVPRYFRSQ